MKLRVWIYVIGPVLTVETLGVIAVLLLDEPSSREDRLLVVTETFSMTHFSQLEVIQTFTVMLNSLNDSPNVTVYYASVISHPTRRTSSRWHAI